MVASARELETLQQMSILNRTGLDPLMTGISTYLIEADMYALFHLHVPALQHAIKSNNTALRIIVAGVTLHLFILYYCTDSHFWNIMKIHIRKIDNRADEVIQKSQLIILPQRTELNILLTLCRPPESFADLPRTRSGYPLKMC